MSKITEALAACNMDQVNNAVSAAKEAGPGLKPGAYIGTLSATDIALYEVGTAKFPRFSLVFEIDTAPEGGDGVGRTQWVSFRLGPTQKKDGTVITDALDAGRIKQIYRRMFAEDPPALKAPNGAPLTGDDGSPVVDTDAMLTRISEDGIGCRFHLKVTEKKSPGGETYTNVYVNNVVS